MHDHRAHPHLPPGPNGSPLRNLRRFTSDMHGLFEDARRDHGDVFTLRVFGARPLVCFASADAAREIIRESGVKLGTANEIVQAVAGTENILLRNGAPHALHRRRLMPAFAGEPLASVVPTMRAVIDDAIDTLPVGEAVTLVPWVRRVALTIIQRCLFGMADDAGSRALASDVLSLAEQGQTPTALILSVLTPPSILQRVTRGRIADDGTRLDDPAWMGPFTRHPLVRANRRVQERLLAHVRAVREGGVVLPPDAVFQGLLGLADKQDARVSDQALADDLVTLLIAGHDTTATSFSWLMLMLARAPDAVDGLRRELTSAGGYASLDGARIEALPYLDATIRESMRLSPIAVGVGRTTLAPITIGGIDLPADVGVMAIAAGPQRDEATFADPARFDPSRLVGQRLRPEQWFPFGGGYRRCIGAHFATIELCLLVSAFVDRVAFEGVDPTAQLGHGTKGMIIEPKDGGLIAIRGVRPRGTPSTAASKSGTETQWRS